jgi:hypothetical protein
MKGSQKSTQSGKNPAQNTLKERRIGKRGSRAAEPLARDLRNGSKHS